jgi:deoxyribodipyrimidine photolyase-related protein
LFAASLINPVGCGVILLVFPNQLFATHPGLNRNPDRVVLIEDSLFFGDRRYPLRFHKQKLWLHRASMKRYEVMLQNNGFPTTYVEYDARPGSLQVHLSKLCRPGRNGGDRMMVVQPIDFILEKRLARISRELATPMDVLPNPGFINDPQENLAYRAGKKRWFMADFYKWQRRRLDILVEDDQPFGGKWSLDPENRKKVPKKLLSSIPALPRQDIDAIDVEARDWVERRFPDNPGHLKRLVYPTSHGDATRWLDDFLAKRFCDFGDYEDAIVEGQSTLWHSVLTPCLNSGLLTPRQVVEAALKFAAANEVPLNSLEGFVRQIIGWREFIRATYQDLGVKMRTGNHWRHQRRIPESFYDGTTGIVPVDDAIRRILDCGYTHHIERLMVLGGFMFLCEFYPDDIYKWFMEMFIDSYDWVMVPNVYAMSQNADGGMITTKPYFSGSSYIRRMSHYKQGPWCDIWDGLYWRWIWNHADELSKNPRWAMMCRAVQKMDRQTRENHLRCATRFLRRLDEA